MKSPTGKDAKGGSCQGKQDKRHGSKVPKGLTKMSKHGLQTRNTNREPEKIRSLRAWRLHEGEGDRMWRYGTRKIHSKQKSLESGFLEEKQPESLEQTRRRSLETTMGQQGEVSWGSAVSTPGKIINHRGSASNKGGQEQE